MTTEDAPTDSPALTVLELLAQEAPPARLEELQRIARRRGMSPEQLAELEQAVRLARGVNASAEQRRRREAGLAALIDATRDMALRDGLDELLDTITCHARRLLNFDMAYVSLRLPDRGSYVRNSDGETTANSVGLEIDSGFGLGEWAQTKQAPFWTSDYLADDRFPHSRKIDEVVSAEGLHAVLAVPMSQGSTVLGALYGAHREVRHFTPDDVSLLRSLAVLSAFAIEEIRRMGRIQARAADAEAAGARLAERLGRMERLAELQARLTGLVLGGGALRDVVELAGAELDGVLVLRSADGRTLAATGDLPVLDPDRTVKAIADSHATGAPVAVTDTVWATHVTTGVAAPGVLLLQRESPLTSEDGRLLYAAGQTAALVQLFGHSAGAAAGPARDECLDALLTTSHPPRGMTERVRRLGLDPDGRHVVLAVRPEGAKQGEAAVWASSYSYRHYGLKTVRGDCLVLLLPGNDASSAARTVGDELSRFLGHPVTVGAAGPAAGLAPVAEVYQEARRCLDALVSLGGTGGTAAARDLGFLGLLLSDDHDVEAFIASTVGAVVDYDRKRSTHLVATLEAYFTSGSSPMRAAGHLHVHPNTVSRRLERITELLGPDWQKPANALELQLALRLLRARDAIRRHSDNTGEGAGTR
ncbi:helix-turn-helix domain-containing protein [Streptomyces sp. Rer75]|uniref:helix-turn-helix domain-containing protein n=1 Tax=Streptomyces sp. Rer75 TaxID=2750011 RepID=UPI00211F29E0|nr:helix-turn-helix domain-containing protein [Streptomyces sp. Rer75]